jgi:hypothetical protein
MPANILQVGWLALGDRLPQWSTVLINGLESKMSLPAPSDPP